MAARWGRKKLKMPVFESGKRSCQYLIFTLKVVPLYDVNPEEKNEGFGGDIRKEEMEKGEIAVGGVS